MAAFPYLLLLLPLVASSALPGKSSPASDSVLVTLLESSDYADLSELVEKALLLRVLEQAVSTHNITIFAPKNKALGRNLDSDFGRFLLEPGNLKSLQELILFHVTPNRIDSNHWPGTIRETMLADHINYEVIVLNRTKGEKFVNRARVIGKEIIRPDGIIYGIENLLVPKSVQLHYENQLKLRTPSAVLPEGAPTEGYKLEKRKPLVPAAAPPVSAIFDGLSLGQSPAPGPSAPLGYIDGELHVRDFIQTLLHYGGYYDMADLLVNSTSIASEMGRLVSEGYVLTVLAPNDESMAKLAADRLDEPEKLVYYHLIPEYQTEESLYSAVRRFGKVKYSSLRAEHKVAAEASNGSVKLGEGEGSGYLFDPDIYTDGRISVQGINGVLLPP